jgi:hypothetical protein
MAGLNVIVPVNFRQVMLPVATVSLVGAAAAGEAFRAGRTQSAATITEDDITGHLDLRGWRALTIFTMGPRVIICVPAH